MSVLCCHVPDFLVRLSAGVHPAGSPLALLGPDGQVWAASTPARRHGVQVQMSPSQARMRCPEVAFQDLDVAAAQAEQQALLAALARWALPVEGVGWGAAYVSLGELARNKVEAQGMCAQAGQAVRQVLGRGLQPALGWNTGKFTARVAALGVAPGRMRLVEQRDEVSFLRKMPISLLPLPPAAVQQLQWLGIRTLGQFAALPPVAVQQRFGRAGRLAQRWAQGHDDRPVRDGVGMAPEPLAVDFDPPTALLTRAVAALQAALAPHLEALAGRLEGIHRLRLDCRFVPGAQRRLDLLFGEPVGQAQRLGRALERELGALVWPAALETITCSVLEVGEVVVQQLALLPAVEDNGGPAPEAVPGLALRYGHLLFRGRVVDPTHPVPERRIAFQSLAPGPGTDFAA